MCLTRLHFISALGLAFCVTGPFAHGADLRITIPRRSALTPVQRLNRDGVEAVQKHEFDKAEALFYKAYLFDPADPFTLNNLGYVSEKDGDLETAQFFYDRARKASDAGARIGLATQITAQGANLGSVANGSTLKVGEELQVYSQERRGEPGPIELTPRYGTSQPDTAPANPNGNTQPQGTPQPQ